VPIREGLGRLDGVAFISKSPDVKAGTCELRLQDGRFMGPLSLSNHVYNIRVGARVRGVEATVAGLVERSGANFVLRVRNTNTVFQLAPLSRKVQQIVATKQPQPATPAEASAFSSLTEKFKKARTCTITGPLVQTPDGSFILEVRSSTSGARTSPSAATRHVSTRL
jgi:hypothetical protein